METKLCKYCQTEIPKKAKVCPNCRKKQGGIGKWIIITVVVFLFIGAMGSSEGDTNEGTSNNSGTIENSDGTNNSNTESNDTTIADKYKIIAETNSAFRFEISDESVVFMNEHENFFPGNDNIKGAISDFVNWEADYSHLAKNINKYTDELCAVGGYVVDIEETDDGSLTFFQISSYDGHNYVFYYLGTLDEVFEETEVYVYALPLDMVTFENIGGYYTEAVVGAACFVQIEFYD